MKTAYSYQRFSSPDQAKGDSIRRQTSARDKWLANNPEVVLDTTLRMTDSGRSAFKRGTNWDSYALAEFVKHITSGTVKPGSYLLVENLDRLSRESPGTAAELFLSIVNRGIVVVQLSPVVTVFRAPIDMMMLMLAVMEMSRGNSESAIKSERGRAVWARKQRDAATGAVVTGRVPGWIKFTPGATKGDRGTISLCPDGAGVVRRIYGMALDGHGVEPIARRLNAENVPTLGEPYITVRGQSHLPPAERERRPVRWSGALVWHILTTPTAIGTYTPNRKRGTANGNTPIPNYYPAVVTPETFYAVAAALTKRSRVGRGRRGKNVYLFSGLLRDWRDGGTLCYWTPGKHPAIIISVNAKSGSNIPWVSFPAATLEAAVLSQLSEVSPDSLRGDNTAALAVDSLSGQLDETDKLIAEWKARMDNPAIVDIVAAKLTEMSVRRRELETALDAARHAAANPIRESWDATRGLLGVAATEDERTRLRTALRRTITEIRCLFRRTGWHRLAVVRVTFANNGGVRTYAISHRPGTANGQGRKPSRWHCRSFPSAEFELEDPLVKSTDDAVVRPLVERLFKFASGQEGNYRCGACGHTGTTPESRKLPRDGVIGSGHNFADKPSRSWLWAPPEPGVEPTHCPTCQSASITAVIAPDVTTGTLPTELVVR